MSDTTNTIAPDDLAALVEKVKRLEEAEGQRDRERTAAEKRLEPQQPKKPTGFAKIQQHAQDQLRSLRERAADEAEREYQEQLAKSAGKRQRLERELEKVAVERREEDERHRLALEPLNEKTNELRKEHDSLYKAPVSIDEVLARPEYAEERERINREFVSESLPVGIPGLTIESVLAARQRMAGVRV